eukprot:TRINITY_DN59609_c0_g1_i4.p1 TRINITY_DN59609_c0_g1~~TRINITY_DN59609_c0_g1_i4.p1  ORF type:complete len:775 (-),score=138.40 TRINITY_DN59609_c0_g1_i4:65-2389(-)
MSIAARVSGSRSAPYQQALCITLLLLLLTLCPLTAAAASAPSALSSHRSKLVRRDHREAHVEVDAGGGSTVLLEAFPQSVALDLTQSQPLSFPQGVGSGHAASHGGGLRWLELPSTGALVAFLHSGVAVGSTLLMFAIVLVASWVRYRWQFGAQHAAKKANTAAGVGAGLRSPRSLPPQVMAIQRERLRLHTLHHVEVFLEMTLLSCVIPSSLDITLEAGYGVIASGWLIGVGYVLGTAGAFAARFLLTPWVQSRNRMLILLGQATYLTSALLYACAANPPHTLERLVPGGARFPLLLLARLVQGAATYFTGTLLKMMGTLITPAGEMTTFMVCQNNARNLGVGAGPLLSALSCRLLRAHGIRAQAAAPLLCMSMLLTLSHTVLWVLLPFDLRNFMRAKIAEESPGPLCATEANWETPPTTPQRRTPWPPPSPRFKAACSAAAKALAAGIVSPLSRGRKSKTRGAFTPPVGEGSEGGASTPLVLESSPRELAGHLSFLPSSADDEKEAVLLGEGQAAGAAAQLTSADEASVSSPLAPQPSAFSTASREAWLLQPYAHAGLEDSASEADSVATATSSWSAACPPEALDLDARAEQLRKHVWLASVRSSCYRAFITMCLEAAVVQILEQTYHYSVADVGFTVGAAFILGTAATPVIHVVCNGSGISPTKTLCAICFANALTSVLLLFTVVKGLPVVNSSAAAWPMLLTIAVITPLGYHAMGIAEALALEFAVPDTYFNAPNLSLVFVFVNNAVARLMAPPLVRFLLRLSGNDQRRS